MERLENGIKKMSKDIKESMKSPSNRSPSLPIAAQASGEDGLPWWEDEERMMGAAGEFSFESPPLRWAGDAVQSKTGPRQAVNETASMTKPAPQA
ncbi:g7407 [Coccomyxa viridis]|uniref:G7407 protein n=1 Tax=Coccomyxa viridis TaxID=1274662 RepID=A0ABP1G2K9_9CHLO